MVRVEDHSLQMVGIITIEYFTYHLRHMDLLEPLRIAIFEVSSLQLKVRCFTAWEVELADIIVVQELINCKQAIKLATAKVMVNIDQDFLDKIVKAVDIVITVDLNYTKVEFVKASYRFIKV